MYESWTGSLWTYTILKGHMAHAPFEIVTGLKTQSGPKIYKNYLK